LKDNLHLGINIGHDSGVALIEGSHVIYAENEERYTRVKNQNGFPVNALNAVIQKFNLRNNLGSIGVEGKKILPFANLKHVQNLDSKANKLLDSCGVYRYSIGSQTGIELSQNVISVYQWPNKMRLKKSLEKLTGTKNVTFFDHHECHIASSCLISYNNNHFSNGIALSMDASGEGWCSRVYRLRNGELEEMTQLRLPSMYSPANFYMNITSLLGFKPLRHEGKITGLAAYGSGKEVASILRPFFSYSGKDSKWRNDLGYRYLQLDSLRKLVGKYPSQDIAAGAQQLLEEILIEYLETEILPSFGGSHIFLSGGLFANVKLNQKIVESELFSGVTVSPNMGDGGLNIGAAALSARKSERIFTSQYSAQTLFLGHKITESEAKSEVQRLGVRHQRVINQNFEIAKRLAEGKVVAIAYGQMEYGPRALGNRSILFAAIDKSVNSWLNARLRRNEFMPFAPIVLERNAQKYFELSQSSDYSNMTITTRVKSNTVSKYPAIVHIDDTARPQVVSDKSNLLYGVLESYQELTGLEVLVNTSFNMHEEPIVRNASEAIKSFQESELDYLFLPGLVLSKHF